MIERFTSRSLTSLEQLIQDAGRAHLTTLFGLEKEAEVPENSIAVGVVEDGTLKTIHPVTHWPAVNPDMLEPSSDREARGPLNRAALAVELIWAVESLLSRAEKSSSSGPELAPFDPAHVVATIASQTCPAGGWTG